MDAFTRIPGALVALTLLTAGFGFGCSGAIHGEAGYLGSFEGGEPEAKEGTAVNVYGSFSDQPVGPSIGVRTKFTPTLRQVALSADVVALSRATILTPYLRAGIHLAQMDQFHDVAPEHEDTVWSIGSPYAEAGVLLVLGTQQVAGPEEPSGGVFLSAGGTVEYDLRFGDAPHQGFWAAMLGVGFFFDLM